MKKLYLTLIAAAVGLAVQANASFFDITFTDGGLNTASGQISATANPDGSYFATAGTLTVAPGGGLVAGTYSLLNTGPGYAVWWCPTGGGGFGYNNLVYPGANPFLDGNGLMFVSADGNTGVNLWGNGVNSYTEMGKPPWLGINGTATLTAVVPEPTTLLAGALMALPFGASVVRVLRRKAA